MAPGSICGYSVLVLASMPNSSGPGYSGRVCRVTLVVSRAWYLRRLSSRPLWSVSCAAVQLTVGGPLLRLVGGVVGSGLREFSSSQGPAAQGRRTWEDWVFLSLVSACSTASVVVPAVGGSTSPHRLGAQLPLVADRAAVFDLGSSSSPHSPATRGRRT